MKAIIYSLLFLSFNAVAQTIIMYADGSTYTVSPEEDVYVSSAPLYRSVSIVGAQPNKNRDYVAPPVTGDEVCWEWAGVAAPIGYSTEACYVEEEEVVEVEEEECNPDSLSFGGC